MKKYLLLTLIFIHSITACSAEDFYEFEDISELNYKTIAITLTDQSAKEKDPIMINQLLIFVYKELETLNKEWDKKNEELEHRLSKADGDEEKNEILEEIEPQLEKIDARIEAVEKLRDTLEKELVEASGYTEDATPEQDLSENTGETVPEEEETIEELIKKEKYRKNKSQTLFKMRNSRKSERHRQPRKNISRRPIANTLFLPIFNPAKHGPGSQREQVQKQKEHTGASSRTPRGRQNVLDDEITIRHRENEKKR